MATWHQSRAKTRLFHDTQWTVLIDPPNECRALMLFQTESGAKEYLVNLARNNPRYASHSYILPPAILAAH